MTHFYENIELHQRCLNYLMYLRTRNFKDIHCIPKTDMLTTSYKVIGENDFNGGVLKQGNTIIIAIPGTNIFQKGDRNSDFNMVKGKQPVQQKTAEKFVVETMKKYPNCKYILTGYSLGGSEVAIIGAKLGIPTVTFNAYGVKNLEGVDVKHPECVINYCNPSDKLITMSNFENHIGTCYFVQKREGYLGKSHNLEAFKPLKTREQVKPQIIAPIKNNMTIQSAPKQSWNRFGNVTGYAADITAEEKQDIINKYKNTESFKYFSDEDIWNRYVDFEENKFFDPENRVFYQNEYNPMLAPEGSNDNLGIREYLRQASESKFRLPSKEDLDARVRTGELVYVHDYVRANGVKVSGYYRAYPRG